MTKLDKLIKLNNLEKQNRKSRLEQKLKQQEYYGDIEDLFDPLTKTLNANSETWLAHNEHNLAFSEQTLRAIDWQNQEFDKQTKMIQQAGSQISETALQMGETASRIGDNTPEINETLKGTMKETQDIAPVFVDTKTAKLLHDINYANKTREKGVKKHNNAKYKEYYDAVMYSTQRTVHESKIQKFGDSMNNKNK